MSTRNNDYQTHPAYGMIGVYRTQGSTRLFGSPLENHPGFICIKIKHGQVKHDCQDWYMGRGTICEVRLSYTQFAEMISAPGVGDGVPCTVEYIEGSEKIPPLPETDKIEAKKVKESFEAECKKLDDNLSGHYDTIEEILKKPNIGKKDREAIRMALRLVSQELRSNLPFILQMFEESTQKVITSAKVEVAGFLDRIVHQTGLKALKDGGLFGKLLSSGDDSTET